MAEMLESYSLSFKKKGNEKQYDLKFKVAKDVKVTYSQVGDVHEIHLNYDKSAEQGNEHNRNYKVTGPLRVQFFQNPNVGMGTEGQMAPPLPPDPDIKIEP